MRSRSRPHLFWTLVLLSRITSHAMKLRPKRELCPGAPDPISSGLVGPLGSVLEQLSRGGGAKGINIDEVSVQDYVFKSVIRSGF